MRSELRDPQTWADDLPSTGVLAKTLSTTDETLTELELYYGADYAKGRTHPLPCREDP